MGLVKACGGRTAHKGGRHGHRMNAKLARIEKAEAEYMQNHKSKEVKSAANRLEEGPDDCAAEVKKKKKKRKREKDLDETIAEPDTIDVIRCDENKKLKKSGEEENIENEEPEEEIKTKKKKSKKSKKSDEISTNETHMLLPAVKETPSKKEKEVKEKEVERGFGLV